MPYSLMSQIPNHLPEKLNSSASPMKEKVMSKGMGFKAAQAKVEKEGYSKKSAGAIVANATRKASPAAKKANPNLKKVK